MKKYLLLVALFLPLSSAIAAGGLVPCTNDCNLCYLLVGISNIFQYLTGALLTVAFLLGITIAGLSYMVSGAFPKALNFAKTAFTNSLKGFLLALCAWIILNGIMNIVGYKNPQGGTWYQHVCSGGGAQVANSNNNKTACDTKNKILQSVTIQCAEQKETLKDNGSGFYVTLDTLSGDEKGKTKQLKAIGKYSCDGTTSEEDITAQAEWKASDETQIKVAKGLVEAVTKNMTSESPPYVEAKFQEKNSNQAKVYINSCPNTKTADIAAKNKLSFLENNLLFQKARAQTGEPLADAACAGCGQISTCHWVAGSKDKEPPFVIIFMRRNTPPPPESSHPCTKKVEAWNDEVYPKGKDDFAEGIKNVLLPQMEYIPNLSKDSIALYYSDLIGEKDSSCLSGKKFTSYGYLYSGTGDPESDFAYVQNRKDAYYCSGSFAGGAATFAHAHIGHIIGNLDDEFESTESKYDHKKRESFTNCTFKNDCQKWNTKPKSYIKDGIALVKPGSNEIYRTEVCEKGCYYNYEGVLYRSIKDGIMSDGAGTTFGKVDEALINDHVQNWSDGGTITVELTEKRDIGDGCGAAIVKNIEAMEGWTFTCLNLPPKLLDKARWMEGLGDCSSTTSRAYTQAGCKNPGISTFEAYSKASSFPSDLSSLKAGDALVVNNGKAGHMGICLDNGCTRLMGACTAKGIYQNCDGAGGYVTQSAMLYGTYPKLIKVSDFCANAKCKGE